MSANKTSALLQAADNQNQPLITADNGVLSRTHFNLIRLAAGQTFAAQVDGFETLYVVLSGNCDIAVGVVRFEDVGRRKDIWSGQADSVYAGTGNQVVVKANVDGTEIAVAGGLCDQPFAPFRIRPEEVEMVDVGSPETHSRRRIYHILGNAHHGRAGHLLVSELYADPGCWSGYPPHKHDEDRGEEETDHEEVYHFRYDPPEGFGAQYAFDGEGNRQVYMTTDGDTFLLRKGFHPTVTSPGHRHYIFTILVGKTQRSLVQHFKPEHQHLMNEIPGIAEMRAKFK